MLDSMCKKVGIEEGGRSFVSTDGLLHLALASGGVPRDYLNTLVESIPAARGLKQTRVTPRTVYRGAGRLSYRTELRNLREDVAGDAERSEQVFAYLRKILLEGGEENGLADQSRESRHAPARA